MLPEVQINYRKQLSIALSCSKSSSVKAPLSYKVHSYLSIIRCELPKECLHEGETSLLTKAYIVLSKLSDKNKQCQKEDILYNMYR